MPVNWTCRRSLNLGNNTIDTILGVQVVRGEGSARVYPFDKDQQDRTQDEMELLAIRRWKQKPPSLVSKGQACFQKFVTLIL